MLKACFHEERMAEFQSEEGDEDMGPLHKIMIGRTPVLHSDFAFEVNACFSEIKRAACFNIFVALGKERVAESHSEVGDEDMGSLHESATI